MNLLGIIYLLGAAAVGFIAGMIVELGIDSETIRMLKEHIHKLELENQKEITKKDLDGKVKKEDAAWLNYSNVRPALASGNIRSLTRTGSVFSYRRNPCMSSDHSGVNAGRTARPVSTLPRL